MEENKNSLAQHPSELTGNESKALCRWAGVDLSKCNNKDGSPNILLFAGASRNVIRAAENWGPKLVAFLAEHDLIQPGDTPEDALFRLWENS
jgi:hypothetical protein